MQRRRLGLRGAAVSWARSGDLRQVQADPDNGPGRWSAGLAHHRAASRRTYALGSTSQRSRQCPSWSACSRHERNSSVPRACAPGRQGAALRDFPMERRSAHAAATKRRLFPMMFLQGRSQRLGGSASVAKNQRFRVDQYIRVSVCRPGESKAPLHAPRPCRLQTDPRCDAVVINSGTVRGNKQYSDTISYGDLKQERGRAWVSCVRVLRRIRQIGGRQELF